MIPRTYSFTSERKRMSTIVELEPAGRVCIFLVFFFHLFTKFLPILLFTKFLPILLPIWVRSYSLTFFFFFFLQYRIYTKGASEIVLGLCTHYITNDMQHVAIDQDVKRDLNAQIEDMAQKGNSRFNPFIQRSLCARMKRRMFIMIKRLSRDY